MNYLMKLEILIYAEILSWKGKIVIVLFKYSKHTTSKLDKIAA